MSDIIIINNPSTSSAQTAKKTDVTETHKLSINGELLLSNPKLKSCFSSSTGKEEKCYVGVPENKVIFEKRSVLQKPGNNFIKFKEHGLSIGLSPKLSFSEKKLNFNGISISAQKKINSHLIVFGNCSFNKSSPKAEYGLGIACSF